MLINSIYDGSNTLTYFSTYLSRQLTFHAVIVISKYELIRWNSEIFRIWSSNISLSFVPVSIALICNLGMLVKFKRKLKLFYKSLLQAEIYYRNLHKFILRWKRREQKGICLYACARARVCEMKNISLLNQCNHYKSVSLLFIVVRSNLNFIFLLISSSFFSLFFSFLHLNIFLIFLYSVNNYQYLWWMIEWI